MICTISFQSFHITALSSEVLSCRLLGLPAAWWIQRLLHLQRLGHSHPGHARHNLAMAKGKVRGHDIQYYIILSNCTTIHTSTPACTTSYVIYIYCHITVDIKASISNHSLAALHMSGGAVQLSPLGHPIYKSRTGEWHVAISIVPFGKKKKSKASSFKVETKNVL